MAAMKFFLNTINQGCFQALSFVRPQITSLLVLSRGFLFPSLKQSIQAKRRKKKRRGREVEGGGTCSGKALGNRAKWRNRGRVLKKISKSIVVVVLLTQVCSSTPFSFPRAERGCVYSMTCISFLTCLYNSNEKTRGEKKRGFVESNWAQTRFRHRCRWSSRE